ncbi:MAG: hypothetical protein U0T84_02240 [Chitinophagales bacterium]
MIRTFVYSHGYQATAVAVYAYGLSRFHHYSCSIQVIAWIFFAVLAFYSYVRSSASYLHPGYAHWLSQYHQFNKAIMLIAATAAAVAFLFLTPLQQFVGVGSGLVTALYYWQLRRIGWLKPIIVASVFALITTGIPAAASEHVWFTRLPLAMGLLLANLLLFELRDADADARFQLHTWPAIIGANKLKWTIGVLLVFDALVPFPQFTDSRMPMLMAYAMPHLVCLQTLWYFFYRKTPAWYYAVIGDGWLALLGCYALLISFLRHQ